MTPSGKPQPGDVLVAPNGDRAVVVKRFPGNVMYSCKVRKPDGREVIITEVDYWLQHGWQCHPRQK